MRNTILNSLLLLFLVEFVLIEIVSLSFVKLSKLSYKNTLINMNILKLMKMPFSNF